MPQQGGKRKKKTQIKEVRTISTGEKVFCNKCRKTMLDNNFYTYKDGRKCELCKKCLTMHVDNWDPDTFLWILKKFDVPYVEEEWQALREKEYTKNPQKVNGMSILGKYLSKMRLNQWKDYTWEDTERLKAEMTHRTNEEGTDSENKTEYEKELDSIKEAYENGEISEAQWQTYKVMEAPPPIEPPKEVLDSSSFGSFELMPQEQYEEIDLPDIAEDLTEEDKTYLALKWGRFYRADEWVSLEKLYEEFMNSFDIQGAARIDTLKMICKTSLKMNNSIDAGDIDAYQKLSRVYDSLMKSAKFNSGLCNTFLVITRVYIGIKNNIYANGEA